MISSSNPVFISLSGILVAIIFLLLPMDPGYELALFYVPLFFFLMGIVMSIVFWLYKRFFSKGVRLTFNLFFWGNFIIGTFVALDMAFNLF